MPGYLLREGRGYRLAEGEPANSNAKDTMAWWLVPPTGQWRAPAPRACVLVGRTA